MDRSGVFETVIGLAVIAVAVLFVIYAYGAAGRTIGGDQYRLEAVFGRVDGITAGAEVRIAGLKVGSVTGYSLNLDTYEANLELAIDRGVQVPYDSVAKIVNDGLLGGAHVAIEPGAAEEYLIEGERIAITQGSIDLVAAAMKAFTSSSNAPASEPEPAGGSLLD